MYITNEDEKNYREMDEIFIKTGTDKSSKLHDYTRTYAPLFNPIRNRSLKFLEIGLQFGFSAKAWEEYFPSADLYFIDIDLKQVTYQSPRCKYHYADQSKPQDLQKFINEVGGDFDIIIEDGGHTSTQQLTTFKTLFPALNKGGIFVIEDLWWSLQRPFPTATFDYLKKLIDEINYKGSVGNIGGHLCPNYTPKNMLQDQIDSMTIKNGLAIITRRQI